ncbi:hypothetical protein LPJ61_001368 [Coemansia biformis]|uniref:Uncharacterized protein n=1 Tax=Coemansia biformis TaxID=1286918 RepID=A0A9W7YHV0_9FUNG|nr:hypothetical protein LPJ61_001368 [Coemansia biformis]
MQVGVSIAGCSECGDAVEFGFSSAKPTMKEIIDLAAASNVHIHGVFHASSYVSADGTLRNNSEWTAQIALSGGGVTSMEVAMTPLAKRPWRQSVAEETRVHHMLLNGVQGTTGG